MIIGTQVTGDVPEQIKKQIEWYRNQGLGEDNERKKLQKELEQKIKQGKIEKERINISYC